MIIAEANVSPFAALRNTFYRIKICFPGSKTISEFVQKHFAFSANVSSFERRGNVSGNKFSATVSSFAGAFTDGHHLTY